jgi:hypothetical protein
MRCFSCEPLLERYLNGGLRPSQQAGVAQHVAGCAHCSQLLDALKVLDAMLITTHAPALPHDFTHAVMTNVRARPVKPARRVSVAFSLAIYLAVAWVGLLIWLAVDQQHVRALAASAPEVLRAFATTTLALPGWALAGVAANAAIVLIVFLALPIRTRIALDRLERAPGWCALSGIVAASLAIPAAVLMAVSVFLLPLVAVEAAALFAGAFVGTAALALLVGRRFYQLFSPRTLPSPPVALLLGLILVTSAEFVPILGFVVLALALLIGLGAAILACMPDRIMIRSTD